MRAIPPLTITDAMLTSCTVAEPSAGETAWNAATSYTVGTQAIRTTTHRIYQNLIAGVDATLPENAPTRWLDVGPTNRWAQFDTLRNSATVSTGTNTMTVVITPGQRVDSLAVMGAVGETVTASMTVSGLGTVWSATDNLILRNTLTWSKYFFGTFKFAGSAVHFDLPPYSNGVITVTISRASGTVAIGALVIGQSVYLGDIQTQAQSTANNFSTITRDQFGNATLVQRRTVPGTSQTLHATTEMVDSLRDLRALGNAVPMVWSGLDDKASNPCFESLLILGVYKEFTISMENTGFAPVSLSLEEI
jgi:hypothetical protein